MEKLRCQPHGYYVKLRNQKTSKLENSTEVFNSLIMVRVVFVSEINDLILFYKIFGKNHPSS